MSDECEVDMGLNADIAAFDLAPCFDYVDANAFNYVNVYKSTGAFSTEDIAQYLSFPSET